LTNGDLISTPNRWG